MSATSRRDSALLVSLVVLIGVAAGFMQVGTAPGVTGGSTSSGVASLTGDGTIFNNSASTGAVTLTLANAATGTGGVVLANSPALVAPVIGSASASNLSFSANTSHIKTLAANKDISGYCTMTAGTCSAITFSAAYSNEPACTVTWDGITGTLTGILSSQASTSQIKPTSSVGTDTAKVAYICFGNPN